MPQRSAKGKGDSKPITPAHSAEYSPEEAERRSEANLKRLLAMPPKPHKAEPKKRAAEKKR